MRAKVMYGIREAACDYIPAQVDNTTVGDYICSAVAGGPDQALAGKVTGALGLPGSTIEVRSGAGVQVVSADMPLRELISPGVGELQITVSQPHVGG